MSKVTDVQPITQDEEVLSKETSIVKATNESTFVVDQQLARLNKDELKQVKELKKSINFDSTVDLLHYGNELGQRREAFSDAILQKYKNKDITSVSDTLTGLVTSLKEYQVEESDGFFSRLFRRGKNKIETMRIKYDNVNENVNKVAGKLENEIITLTNDIQLLDKLYNKNIDAFKEHTIFIIAAKQRLDEVRNNELMDLRIKAEETNLPEDVEEYRNLVSKCDTFEKYIYDLELSRTLCLLSLPRLKAIQAANEVLVQKIRTTITTTIPMWKDTIANAVIAENTKKSLSIQNAVDDATNQMLKRMADVSKEVSVGATNASQRGVVDMDTMKYMYEKVLETANEMRQIEEEGRATREQSERELLSMEQEYSGSLVDCSK